MTELVPVRPVDDWVNILGPVGDLAGKIASTEFAPKGLRGKPAAVAAAILTGRELQLGPMASLRGVQVIDGTPSLTAQMTAARILAAGHQLQWIESTDKSATVRITRCDGLGEAEARFTIADAQRAGLAQKTNWVHWPRAMLRARALSECAGMICADVILGLEAADDIATAMPGSSGTRTVQIQTIPEPEPEPEPGEVIEADIIEPPATPIEIEPEPVMTTAEIEPPVTPAQLRKIGALIGDWEAANSRRLDRTERRRMIGFLAGVEDPDALASAKDLTMAQASLAIDTLTDQLGEVTSIDAQGVIG